MEKLSPVIIILMLLAGLGGTGNGSPVTESIPQESAAEEDDRITVDGKSYRLIFSDDFEGTELDGTKWERCPEYHRQDMENYWDDSMTYLDGEGHLVIGFDKKSGKYLSGAVRSKNRFEHTCGYYEIRCTVNSIPGCWTAFWLMGDTVSDESGGGVNGTEIDIYESPYFNEKKIQHTLNWDGYGSAHKSEGKVVDADVYDGEFHTFSLLWTEKEYVFFTDGKESWRTDAKKALGTCKVPLYMKISSETGSWTGAPPAYADLPDCMKADYVKVWEAENE